MLRLSILLIVAMGFAATTLGENNGQLRPGLAKAAAEGRLDEVWAEARARDAAREAAASDAEGAFVETATASVALPEVAPDPLPEPEPAATETASAEPAPAPSAVRETVEVLPDPVFSLQSYGNESVPGEEAAKALEPEATLLPEVEPVTEPEPEVASAEQGQVWVVNADSVNVRAEPSTEADILTKLSTGEELLVLAQVDEEWAKIVIEGDGVEGYVAIRFLAPATP